MSSNKSTRLTTLEVAKRFFQQFKAEHLFFSQQIQGTAQPVDQFDYASLLLNRLLVLYFLQKRHLLDNDLHYLSSRLHQTQQQIGRDCFYRQFLLQLCSQLYNEETQTGVLIGLIGTVPILNLPIFKLLEMERTHTYLSIPDSAFEQIFAFFELYNWQIDACVLQQENELRPDILAYIFEHAIDQKRSGAYYTQEDITTYIASNAVVARLFTDVILSPSDKGDQAIRRLLHANPDRYIHPAIRSTTHLVEEIEIEYQQRRVYYTFLYTQLRRGTFQSIEDLVTYNIDLVQLAVDMIRTNQNDAFVVRVYTSLKNMLILDPTCGTGAFLFSALTVLTPLYAACIERMSKFRSRHRRRGEEKLQSLSIKIDIDTILGQVEAHPNLEHFILSTIIQQNLYGVELMPEAVEICQLRLSLELLAHGACRIEQNGAPRTNIRVGDALLGDIQHARYPLYSMMKLVSSASNDHRQDTYNKGSLEKPFHWHQEFPVLVERGGFDVIIGNPPYLEYNQVKQNYAAYGYEEKKCGNLYAAVIERSLALCCTQQSYLGLIVPISICSGERFASLRQTLCQAVSTLWIANFEIFPCRLFENAFQRVSIVLAARGLSNIATTLQVTRTHRWFAQERAHLLQRLIYTRVESNQRLLNFPKLASPHQEHIIQKMLQKSNGKQIATFLHPQQTGHFVYYQEATNYWMKAACRVPYYKKNGKIMNPAHGRFLFLQEERAARIIMALMNSSLFYIWFTTYADGFHLSHALVKAFPVHDPLLTSQSLYELAHLLEKDIQLHTRMSTHNIKHNTHTRQQSGQQTQIEIEEYQMRYSKDILDKVDTVLAQYYKFTSEELDFIINYDIKYRLSKRGKK